jgi:hypothetical protein
VRKQLYGLQIVENIGLLEHLNKFNMLNENFGLKVEEEDKANFFLHRFPLCMIIWL